MTVDRQQTRSGQVLVILVLALIAIMAMAGLIVDGGNAYAQQRGTQNATDAASEAGAVVLSQHILALNSGTTAKTDADVLAAINASAAANNIKSFSINVPGNSVALYTDLRGNLLRADGSMTTDPAQAAQVGSGSIPPCTGGTTMCIDYGAPGGVGVASGVRSAANREFKTFISGVIGISQFTSTALATAVSGYASNPCDASQGCALLPVTFATNQNSCDDSGNSVYTGSTWLDWLSTNPLSRPPYTPSNEVLLSLCKKGEGAFGWLDFGCGNTAAQILNPCNVLIYLPTWLQSQPGNPNNVEDELDTYAGNVVGTYEEGLDLEVLIPFFDGLCNEDRPGAEPPNPPADEPPVFGTPPFPGICASNPSGGGANRHYHIPYFFGFILDKAYVQGNNFPDCNSAPGGPPSGPFPGGNGSGGCLKGWFSRVVGAPGPVSGTGGAGSSSPLTVQLIK